MKTLLPFFENGRWGFVDDRMRMCIRPVYQNVREFYDGYAVFESNGYFGFIGVDGNVVLEPKFLDAEDCCGEKAVVEDALGYTVINMSGQQVLPRHYSWLYSLDESYEMFAAQEQKGGKWKVVDLKGREILPLGLDDVDGVDDYGWWRTSQCGVHVFRNRYGVALRQYQYDRMSSFFHNMAVVCAGEMSGVIDRDENEILPIRYYHAALCNDKCITARFHEDGDFALFHCSDGEWGDLRFDYCVDAGYDGMLFVARDGIISLYDHNEDCILKNLGEELQGRYCDRYWRIWENETNMYYLTISEEGIFRLTRNGRRRMLNCDRKD